MNISIPVVRISVLLLISDCLIVKLENNHISWDSVIGKPGFFYIFKISISFICDFKDK